MRKNIQVLAIIGTCLALLLSPLNVAAADKSLVQNSFAIINKKNEITDVELLIQRAQLDIDDFKDATGKDFQVSCEVNNSGQEQIAVMSLKSKNADKMEVETYQTSQYLGQIANGQGGYDDLYAVNGIAVYSDTTVSDTETNGGCTIVTTLYIQWGTGIKNEFKLLRSSVTLSGVLRPSSLKMENCVYTGWDTNQNYYNTKTINYPSIGIYNLYPSTNKYISEYGGYVGAEDTVAFGDGGTMKTSIYYDVL